MVLLARNQHLTCRPCDNNDYSLTPAEANANGWTINWLALTGATTTVKKYYSSGGQRIALRDGNNLRWLVGDHLGSTAYTVNGTSESGEVRYKPYGATRYTTGTTPTTFRYTGQREEATLGLDYYGARWYDPQLGLFLSPDTLVPNATNSMDYNRYLYGRGNPVKYNDPTGHDPCDNGAACGKPSYSPEIQALHDRFMATDHGDYTWEMFYADLQAATKQAGGNLNTANYSTMPTLMSQAYAARQGETASSGTAPYIFFLALFKPDEVYAAVAQAENQRVAQLEGVLAGLAAGGMNAGCSFSADTPIVTEDGAKAIVLIQPGDKVLAWNAATGKNDYYLVTATQSHLDHTLVYLTIDGETILTTPEHPFFTAEREWLPVSEIQIGEHIRRANGSLGRVQAIVMVQQAQVMYNLTVAKAHTFFAGKGQWLVHNQCGPQHYRPLRQGDLPEEYVSPKKGPRQVTVEYGPYRGRQGWEDKYGDIWVPSRPSESHGGPHWDVQINGGKEGHRNVYVPCPLCATGGE